MSYPYSLPAGNPLITLTHPKPSLWVIELHNGDDSRLSFDLLTKGLSPALDIVEKEWRTRLGPTLSKKEKSAAKGSLIIVGKKTQDKFFSNGLEFEKIQGDATFFPKTFNPLLVRLLTFPIPTIAAINGHAFAGGFFLAMLCDYRVMTDGANRRAWVCMNEIHFGASLPPSFAAGFSAKLPSHIVRKIFLEGHRFTPQEALAANVIDHVASGGTAGILAKAEELADSVCTNAQTGVWGQMKSEIYRDTIKTMLSDYRLDTPLSEDHVFRSRL